MIKDSIKVFIQGRMSSNRFPGKVLAPFGSYTIIENVYMRCKKIKPPVEDIIITTSNQKIDDPLYSYCNYRGIKVFRGDLNNVTLRLVNAAKFYNSNFILRINGDSPLIDPHIIENVISNFDSNYDLITNVFPRSYPKGQSVEIIKLKTLENISSKKEFTKYNAEHVTNFIYENSKYFKIKNIINPKGNESKINLSIDTLSDYKRLLKLWKT